MSRSGRIPITLSGGVTVTSSDNNITVKGPKGQIVKHLPPLVKLEHDGDDLWIRRDNDDKEARAFQGLVHSTVTSAIEGVTQGITRQLELVGLGYRAELKGKKLVLQLGFCHPVEYALPEGVSAAMEAQTGITLTGIDKQLVGQVAAELKALRPPDPYKGKGIRYKGETIRLKAGKAAAGATA